MPPSVHQGLSQNLSQQQTLSPQMRQSLEILQANTLELSQLISQIAEINPTLEVVEEHETLDEPEVIDAEKDLEQLSEFDDAWREDLIMTAGSPTVSQDDEERREHLYNSIVAPKTLQQHLLDQLNTAAAKPEIYEATEFIIGCINDKGFLDEPLENLAPLSGQPLKILRKALAMVQRFDPSGVGAENLTESLLLQLQLMGLGNSLEARIVDGHLADLARRKITDIARSLGVPQSAVIEAADHISTLNPEPGAAFDATSNPHVRPDLEILRDRDGHFYSRLTDEFIPTLRVSQHYKDLLARLNSDPKARKYLRDNIHESRQIMSAVTQRQETLLKIGSEIIKHQSEFLLHGKGKLRPMTMNDIAQHIGVHPATISRAVSGKYILTPHGLMELRAFFATGYTTKEGAEVSNTAVREAIQLLIDNENTAKPLSDAAIEKQLKEKGLKVARRTIAKYREQMGVLPSHLRKR